MRHLVPKDVTDGTWIRVVAIGGEAIGRDPGHGPCRPKERLGRREIARLAQPCVDQIAVSVNGSIEVTPLPLDLEIRFIDIPAGPSDPVALFAQSLAQQ